MKEYVYSKYSQMCMFGINTALGKLPGRFSTKLQVLRGNNVHMERVPAGRHPADGVCEDSTCRKQRFRDLYPQQNFLHQQNREDGYEQKRRRQKYDREKDEGGLP